MTLNLTIPEYALRADDHAQAAELHEENGRLCSALANGEATINNMQVQVQGVGASIQEHVQVAVATSLNTVHQQNYGHGSG